MNGRLDNAAFPLMIITAAVPNFPRPPFGVGFWDVGVYFGDAGGPQCPPPPWNHPPTGDSRICRPW